SPPSLHGSGRVDARRAGDRGPITRGAKARGEDRSGARGSRQVYSGCHRCYNLAVLNKELRCAELFFRQPGAEGLPDPSALSLSAPGLHSPLPSVDVPSLMERPRRSKVRADKKKRAARLPRSPGEKSLVGTLS